MRRDRSVRYTYEFEILPEEQGYHAVIPFDFGGATQGDGMTDTINMAADWLQVMVEHALMHRLDLPVPTYGNEPRHGGRVVNVSIEASLDTVRAVRASEAAERLGVSRGRVSQMLRDNLLEGFRKGRDTYVTLDSIERRLADNPGAGRPRKALVTA
jgi:predicted RNase H-like HicB family nuclease